MQIYDRDSLIKVHRRVLLKTNMIDSVIETYAGSEIPKELEQRKVEILSQVFIVNVIQTVYKSYLRLIRLWNFRHWISVIKNSVFIILPLAS